MGSNISHLGSGAAASTNHQSTTSATPPPNIADSATFQGTEDTSMTGTDETTATIANPILNIDITGMFLSDYDKMGPAAVSAWWANKQTEHKLGPFPLLSLPPELRNRIYDFVLATPSSRDLANFKLPPITRTSSQVRRETLPRFFSSNPFFVNVKSNFHDRKLVRQRSTMPGRLPYHDPRDRKNAGVTRIRRPVRAIVKAAGPAAFFRDVMLKISSSPAIHERGGDEAVVTWLQLRVLKGALRLTVKKGKQHPAKTKVGLWRWFYEQDVSAALLEVTNKAKKIAGGADEFKGFSLGQLDEIAQELQYVPLS